MPPRSSLTGSFSVSDANNEVVCPLRNHDGSHCRKRCLGEKRYRSMQEHIRRAHPEHYISKLPATEESFLLMVNTPPHERPAPQPPQNSGPVQNSYSRDPEPYYSEDQGQASQRSSDEYRRGSILPAASAAAALAQLHNHRPDYDWESEQEAYSEAENQNHKQRARFAPHAFEARSLEEKYPIPNNSRPRELLPSSLARSPPGRSSTLPPAPRSVKPNRPRKSSITQNARKGKHERTKSKEHARRMSHDRKAFSAEPQAAAAAMLGKRWEDLIDAAASATEEDSRDLTPVPSSPHAANRASLPPYLASQFQSYHASPLQKTLTPPPPDSTELQPFPSVESSGESGMSGASGHSGFNFHMTPHGLSDPSPHQPPQAVQQPSYHHSPFQPVQIYCAMCRRLSVLKDSYACPECICGLCQDCVDVLVSEQTSRGRIARCPKCGVVGGKFKPFQLDIR